MMNYLRNEETGKTYRFDSVPQNDLAPMVDYSSPIEYGGMKGYRVKGDPMTAIMANGARVSMGVDQAATRKAQMDDLALQGKRQELARGALELAALRNPMASQKKMEDVYGKPPEGTRWTAEGKTEPIPGYAEAKPLNESQANAVGYGTRMINSSGTIEDVGKGGEVQPGLIKRIGEAVPFVGDSLGTMLNWTQSPEQQQVEQAQRDFINAVLRRESGAAIAPSEFDNARKQYFPQPGDSPEVIAQKAQNRETSISAMKAGAGHGGSMIDKAKQRYSIVREAKQAIMQGKDPVAVRARLKELGITDAGI